MKPIRLALLAAVIALLLASPASAARLEAEFTWDNANWGFHFSVLSTDGPYERWAQSYVTWGGALPTAPCGGDGHPETSSQIAGGTFTPVPCSGRGPVTFTLDPLTSNPLQFFVWMAQSGFDYYLGSGPNGPEWVYRGITPTNFTMVLRQDGTEITRRTFTISDYGGGHLVLSYTPGATEPTFDLNDYAPLNDRRVLLVNPRDTSGALLQPYPWFQRFLSRDRAIPIGLRTYVNGVPTPGVAVTLKVLDPPDKSEYVVGVAGGQPAPSPSLSYAGDNVGTLPTLTGTGITANPDGTYSVTSGAEGYISAALEPDATARPGDNYQVEAVFSGATPKKSSVITAWRRMFVEKRKMFRRGHTLVTDAPAGTWHAVVPNAAYSSAAGAPNFAAGDEVILQHAPPHGAAKTASAYYQTYTRITAATPFTTPATLTTAGAGTIALTAGSSTVNGTGTRFDRLVTETATRVGSVINVANRRYVVMAIDNRTRMTVSPVPDTTGAGLPYTIGDTQVAPSTTYVRLTFAAALDRWYGREPLEHPSTGVTTLNDGIAKLTSAGTFGDADVFDSSEERLEGAAERQYSNPMQAAYAEYITLRPPMPVPRVTLASNSNHSQWFIDRWFTTPAPVPVPGGTGYLSVQYVPPQNHQLLLVADTNPNSDVGQTYSRAAGYPPERATALFRGFTEREVADNTRPLWGQNTDLILMKIVVHEIAHQWSVNGGLPGHCTQVAYDSGGPYPTQQTPPAPPPSNTRFCTMAIDTGLTMPAPWNSSLFINQTVWQYGNEHIAFHMTPSGDSEYLTIRRTADPWQP